MSLEHFTKKKTDKFTVWLNKDLIGTQIESAILNGFSSLNKSYSLQRIPSSRFSDVYRFRDNDSVFYFKQYRYRSVWDLIKHLFRASRADRSFQAAAMLKANRFSSPKIAAMGYRNKILKTENFILMLEVKNALSVELFFREHYEKLSLDLLEKRKFLLNFGRFAGRLHSKNISHGDLRLSNVLVTKNGSDLEFFLLDNERTVQHRRLPSRFRLKNLVQINMFQSPYLSRTDQLRFLKAYFSENPALLPKWKKLARKVQNKTSKRLLAKNRSLIVG